MTPTPVMQDALYSLSPGEFQRLSRFITQELGIKMPAGKLTMLQSRLTRRIRKLGLPSLDAYREFLFESPHAEEERLAFIDLVTTNKTEFLREQRHFEFLRREGLPLLGGHFCQVWCAGCSSGEEAYSLAMVLAEYAAAHPGFDYKITATDISTRMLARALDGVYTEAEVSVIPLEWRHRYLLRSRDHSQSLVRIAPELRLKVHFQRLNFMDEAYPFERPFDLVFFRNVMIYFESSTQQRVLDRICAALRVGGLLCVGHTESLIGLDLPLRQLESAVHRKEAP